MIQKYRLFFPDGDWFMDEDGNTEFGKNQAVAIQRRLADHVTLRLVPWPKGATE